MKILSFIPKTQSTEIAIYIDGVQRLRESIHHAQELHAYFAPPERGRVRFDAMAELLAQREIPIQDIDLVITYITTPEIPPGIYMLNDALLELLREGRRVEETPLRSGIFALHLFEDYICGQLDRECLALVVKPAMENEMIAEAVLSGQKGISRNAMRHAFSQRGAASLYAHAQGQNVNDLRLVIAHLGAEIAVCAHDRGRIIDSNNSADGEGPFSPTTSGTLPVDALINLCFSGKYDMDEILRLISHEGGLVAHLGSGELRSVQEAYGRNDPDARFVVEAMAERVAKEIGARAAALDGNLEAVILTGQWAVWDDFTAMIAARTDWIAPVHTHVWESDLYMLAIAAIESYRGNNRILLYGQDR